MFADKRELWGLNAFGLYVETVLIADKVANTYAKSENNFIARSVA
jgi:hypothetical protein